MNGGVEADVFMPCTAYALKLNTTGHLYILLDSPLSDVLASCPSIHDITTICKMISYGARVGSSYSHVVFGTLGHKNTSKFAGISREGLRMIAEDPP